MKPQPQQSRLIDFIILGKILIIIGIILLIILTIDIKIHKYTYRTEVINLVNNNDFHHLDNKGVVVSHLCDNGVIFNNYRWEHCYYISTWEDADIHSGRCMIKIREVKV
jgi:hypothetical protein